MFHLSSGIVYVGGFSKYLAIIGIATAASSEGAPVAVILFPQDNLSITQSPSAVLDILLVIVSSLLWVQTFLLDACHARSAHTRVILASFSGSKSSPTHRGWPYSWRGPPSSQPNSFLGFVSRSNVLSRRGKLRVRI